MNVSSAYSQQDVWGIQEAQRAQAGAGRKRHAFASEGDTVSISPEAQALAKAVQEQAQLAQTQAEDAQAATVQQAARQSAEASDTVGSYHISLISPTAQIFNKLLIRKTIGGDGPNQIPVVAFWSEDPTEQEYFRALYSTYNGLLEEMGLGVSGPDDIQPALTPEQLKAFNEELISRLRSDERIHSLMEQFGINAQLEETDSETSSKIGLDLEKMAKHSHFLKGISDAYDKGLISADEVGKIMAQYAQGEITADDLELVLARYGKTEEKETLQDLLSSSVDEYMKSQRDEDAIRLLKENERLNLLMQQIGVEA